MQINSQYVYGHIYKDTYIKTHAQSLYIYIIHRHEYTQFNLIQSKSRSKTYNLSSYHSFPMIFRQALVAFKPRSLKNLMLYDEMPSLSPIIDMKVLDATGWGQRGLMGW